MFKILFGSFARTKQTTMSDIDLAIYSDEPMSLLQQGSLIMDLEEEHGRKVDLVNLNNVIHTNPALAYNILFGGKLIECNNVQQYQEIKFYTLRNYLDSQHLRDMKQVYFLDRINNCNLAKK